MGAAAAPGTNGTGRAVLGQGGFSSNLQQQPLFDASSSSSSSQGGWAWPWAVYHRCPRRARHRVEKAAAGNLACVEGRVRSSRAAAALLARMVPRAAAVAAVAAAAAAAAILARMLPRAHGKLWVILVRSAGSSSSSSSGGSSKTGRGNVP
jgi:hypothetical protein